ncbi:MAG TPA: hypothetical protein VHE36_03585 [Sphingomicrobium sp.]|nr:hypothetical protein [Sphingomicrobium sp.]
MSAFLAFAGTTAAHADMLTVTATGTIGTRCSIAVASPFSSPDLSSSGSVGATATVNCNTGFKVNATSANGAIKSATPATTNFTNTLPYDFTLAVPLESGAPMNATCASSALVAGQSTCALSPANGTGLSSSGRASINKTATLTLAYTVPTLPTHLIAGSYSDTITLTVATVP